MALFNGEELTVDLKKGGCLFKMDKYGGIEYNISMTRTIKATCEMSPKINQSNLIDEREAFRYSVYELG